MEYLTLNAELQTKANDDGVIEFTGLAYSGDPVARPYGDLVINLDNINLKAVTPLLYGHNTNALPIGRAEIVLKNGELIVQEGKIYNDAAIPNSQGVSALLNHNHPIQLSIGVRGSLEKYKAKQLKQLNGKSQQVDAVLNSVSVIEVSVVTIPADSKTFVERMHAFSGQDVNFSNHLNKELLKVSTNDETLSLQWQEELSQAKQLRLELAKEKTMLELSKCNIEYSDVELSAFVNLGNELPAILDCVKKHVAKQVELALENVKPNVSLSDVKPSEELRAQQEALALNASKDTSFGFDWNGTNLLNVKG